MNAARKLIADTSLSNSIILELFQKFPIFSSFPNEFREHLAASGEILEFDPDFKLLVQGQMNEHLFFLVRGEIGIYVDGGRVTTLHRPGDLIGEMSLISKRPVGATIVTEGHVQLIRVDTEKFLATPGANRDLYLSVLYRIYASVLVEKLDTTNQKAKYFEELNGKLTEAQISLRQANENLERKVEERTLRLEQQNSILFASKSKFEDLINSQRSVMSKLTQINIQHLVPLKQILDEIRKSDSQNPLIERARTALYEVQHLMAPLEQQFSGEELIQGKRVLFADGNRKQQQIAKMALGGTGVELDIVSSLEEGREKLQNGKYHLVAFDVEMLELGNLARSQDPQTATVLMTSDKIPTYLPALKQLSSIPHIVSRDESDRTFTVKNILTTVTKLLTRNVFGLEKYLNWGVDIQSKPIVSSGQRPELIEEVDAYFQKVGIRSANRDRVKVVLEEMLMNAIYDAPTDESGKHLYNHLPRTTAVSLNPAQQGIVRYATDGMLIGVAVQDPFGSLSGNVLLRYLENNYGENAQSPVEGKGGAGRGLHQIVENADLVVFNIHPHRRTEVIALFNVEVKEKEHQNPSFHLFVKNSKD